MGNQFVWIPVPNETIFTRTQFDTSTGEPKTGLSADYSEPCENGYPGEETEFNTMKTQVLKYGGFYIGRFEAGINSTTLRTGPSNEQNVVCKKGVAPFNWVPWGTSNADISSLVNCGYFDYDAEWIGLGQSYGAVYLSKNMYLNASSVTSTLCYGSQWDAMCRYIGDSQRKMPTKSSPQLTGSVSTDMSKNIYDLAGNCFELSMEYSTSSDGCRHIRGGACNSSVPIFNRYDAITQECSDSLDYGGVGYTFRVTIYVK